MKINLNREKFLKKLKKYGLDNDIPNISEVNAKFLRDLIKIQKPKNILEIGTANGYSTINLGIEIEKNGGILDTIEFSQNSFDVAKLNIKEVGLEKTINQICGNALDIIPKLKKTYDFVFIDGMKRRTYDFLNLVLPMVKNNGIIIIDDVIKFKTKMIGLYEFLDDSELNYNVIPIDSDDGIIMIVK